MKYLVRRNQFFGAAQLFFFLNWRVTRRTRWTQEINICTGMASSSVADDQVWEKTSTPRVVHFKRDGKYRLGLHYTLIRARCLPEKTSQERFDTEAEASASSLS